MLLSRPLPSIQCKEGNINQNYRAYWQNLDPVNFFGNAGLNNTCAYPFILNKHSGIKHYVCTQFHHALNM